MLVNNLEKPKGQSRGTNNIVNTKHRTKRNKNKAQRNTEKMSNTNPQKKTGGNQMFSGRVGSSCFLYDIRNLTHVKIGVLV